MLRKFRKVLNAHLFPLHLFPSLNRFRVDQGSTECRPTPKFRAKTQTFTESDTISKLGEQFAERLGFDQFTRLIEMVVDDCLGIDTE